MDVLCKKGNVGMDIGWRWLKVGWFVVRLRERGGDVYDGMGIDECFGYCYCVVGIVVILVCVGFVEK